MGFGRVKKTTIAEAQTAGGGRGKTQAGPVGHTKGVGLYSENSGTLLNWMCASRYSLWLQSVMGGSVSREMVYQRAAVAVAETEDDGCLDEKSRNRNGDKWAQVGNIEEIKLTRISCRSDLRCVGEEEEKEIRTTARFLA